ncbi:MAG TPA: hypothetical protein VGM37_04410 [Armatimonadota bacterium]|jgi:hypothetical protein
MLKANNDKPTFSPGPWARGALYTLLALGALLWGHLSGERPLTPFKWAALGSFAVLAGVAIALLQNWARDVSHE